MSYQIAEQPIETSLKSYVVHPARPLLAFMLAGAWLAWPWFAFNSLAFASPSRRREVALCAVAPAITAALAMVVFALYDRGVLPDGPAVDLALLAIVVFKLAITYSIYSLQSRTFPVYEYYGGTVRDPRMILSAGWLLRGFVVGFIDDPLWVIIVAGGL